MSDERTLLVTGGYGLLGRWLVPRLVQDADCRLILISRGLQQAASGDTAQFESIYGDLCDGALWASLPSTVTHVFHLAARIPRDPHTRNTATIVRENLLPIAHLVERTSQWPHLRQVIYSSSVSVYEPTGNLLTEDSPKRQVDLYGAAKLAGEHLLSCLEPRGIRVACLRFTSLYAQGQYDGTVLPTMVQRAVAGDQLVVFGTGERTQDFLHCSDAASALLLAYASQARGVFIIGSGTPVTMGNLARTVSQVFSNSQAKVVQRHDLADSDLGIKVDISKARKALGYHPKFQLENGLRALKAEIGETQRRSVIVS